MGKQLEIGGGNKAGSAAGSGGGGASTEASEWQGTNLFEAKVSVVTTVQAKNLFCALFNRRVQGEVF